MATIFGSAPVSQVTKPGFVKRPKAPATSKVTLRSLKVGGRILTGKALATFLRKVGSRRATGGRAGRAGRPKIDRTSQQAKAALAAAKGKAKGRKKGKGRGGKAAGPGKYVNAGGSRASGLNTSIALALAGKVQPFSVSRPRAAAGRQVRPAVNRFVVAGGRMPQFGQFGAFKTRKGQFVRGKGGRLVGSR